MCVYGNAIIKRREREGEEEEGGGVHVIPFPWVQGQQHCLCLKGSHLFDNVYCRSWL